MSKDASFGTPIDGTAFNIMLYFMLFFNLPFIECRYEHDIWYAEARVNDGVDTSRIRRIFYMYIELLNELSSKYKKYSVHDVTVKRACNSITYITFSLVRNDKTNEVQS